MDATATTPTTCSRSWPRRLATCVFDLAWWTCFWSACSVFVFSAAMWISSELGTDVVLFSVPWSHDVQMPDVTFGKSTVRRFGHLRVFTISSEGSAFVMLLPENSAAEPDFTHFSRFSAFSPPPAAYGHAWHPPVLLGPRRWFGAQRVEPTWLTPGALGLQFPWWALCAASFFWPAIVLRCAWRNRSGRRRGLCIVCGYDLKVTPDRCPECGWLSDPASAKSVEAAR